MSFHVKHAKACVGLMFIKWTHVKLSFILQICSKSKKYFLYSWFLGELKRFDKTSRKKYLWTQKAKWILFETMGLYKRYR